MGTEPFIPPATADKLLQNFPPGTRHKAKMDIAVSLLGNGMSPNAVFVQLRDKFPDASDREINDVIEYVVKIRPVPSTPRNGERPNYVPRDFYRKPVEPPKPTRTPIEMCEWWTSGARVTPDAMQRSSPTPIPDEPAFQAALALSALYKDTDLLNIVCKFTVDKDKTRPSGGGKVLSRDEWVRWFNEKGVPESEAGAWFRINPCEGIGGGSEGAITDADITDFRYVLVESDVLPVPMQLALYQRLNIPIVAVIMSGGKSSHAWVRLDRPDADSYKATAKRLVDALDKFGIDQANTNPSRLSRLPGSVRTLGAVDSGAQRLIWLNPTVSALTDEGLKRLEESFEFPAIEEKPLRSTVTRAMDRYTEMFNNRGKLGVPTGIPRLDKISGGLKPGQTVVIAGTTGGGKSTMALHMIDAALSANYGVLLFSLEMDKDEIFDLMVAKRCKINRNKFNNGYFSDYDFKVMAEGLPKLTDLPLFIEDQAATSADQIRLRVLQLKAAGKLGLVVVDYIQFVNPEFVKESREQQVALISHKLRTLARETKLPFIILSQLNDEGRLRESRVISHNANIVIMVEVEDDIVTAKVTKGRGIPCNDYILEFDRMYATLIAKEEEKPSDETGEEQVALPYKNE